MWLQWLLEDLRIPQAVFTPLHCDNQDAIQIAHIDVFHEHNKHIDTECHFYPLTHCSEKYSTSFNLIN